MVKQKDLKISPEDTFNLDELSDSDETDSDIEVEDESSKRQQTSQQLQNSLEKYSGDYARGNFFNT